MLCVSQPGRDGSYHMREVMCSGIQNVCVAMSKYECSEKKEFYKKYLLAIMYM